MKNNTKEYSKLYRQTHKEYYKQHHKQWVLKNRDKVNVWRKEYDKTHPHKHREFYNRDYYQLNRQRIGRYTKDWYKKNKEYISDYHKHYKEKNINKIKAYSKLYEKRKEVIEFHKQWRESHPEYRRQWLINNKEARKKYMDAYRPKYYEKNKNKLRKMYRIYSNNRRLINKQIGKLTMEIVQLVYEDNIKKYGTLTCYLCLKPTPFKLDALEHKIPLSRGGTNNYDNLAVACKSCNSKKHNKTYEEYREENYAHEKV